MTKLLSVDSGNVGESLVMAELQMRNYVTARTERNAELFDILACNRQGTKMCAIQVKTIQNSKLTFRLSEKNETYYKGQENCYYVFVSLASEKCPKHRFYVVPFKVVAEEIKRNNDKWLNTPGKRVAQHKPTTMRAFDIDETKFKESNFSILGLDD